MTLRVLLHPLSPIPVLILGLACTGSETAEGSSTSRDSVATAVVQPQGGVVELRAVGRVIFPAETFNAPQLITVRTTNTPATPAGQADYWVVGGGPKPVPLDSTETPDVRTDVEPPPLSYDIRISGEVAPARDYEVELVILDAYLHTLPAGFTPRVFALTESGGPLESHMSYDMMESQFDPERQVVRAQVSRGAVWSRPNGRFEVILLVGSRRVAR